MRYIGHVRLLVCCRHLIQGRGQVRALAGAGLQHAERVTTTSGFLSSSVKLHGRRTISGKLLAFGFVGIMRLLSNYFDLLLSQVFSISINVHLCLMLVRRK